MGKRFTLISCVCVLAGGSWWCGRDEQVPAAQSVIVVSVRDGDSLRAETDDGGVLDVRLSGIDAPELNQAYGDRSREGLARLVLGKQVLLKAEGKDRFGRLLGVVVGDGGISINEELVRSGLAWHFKRYSKDPVLSELERTARANRIGLWLEEGPVPPWEFRASPAPRPLLLVGPLSDESVRGNVRSKRYHLPACPGFDDVSPKNRVGFESEEAALSAGYVKAGNCP